MLVSPLPRVAYAALLILAAALAFIENTEPILDGDLFWHLAYAEQMVERGTLVPDATIYSWTPTSSATIYCAWASELLLYGLWSLAGLPAIFALRYAVVAIVLALVWLFARRSGVERALILILCLVVVAARTGAGTLPKPELFSLLLFTLVVFVYAYVRSGAGHGRPASAWYFAVPALLVVWVNAHGGFILAAPFLAATAAGEILLFAAGSAARLPPRALAQMLGAWILCIPATIVTPYGLAYPVALLDEYAFGTVERPDTTWNSAYRSIFDPSVAGEGYVTWLVGILAGLAVLVALALRHRGRSILACLPLGLALLCYVPLYSAFLRATQFLPIVAAFFALGVAGALAASPTMAQRPVSARGRATAVAAACAAIVAVATILQSVMRPSWYGWPGWGIGENNPVAEAEFLARQPLGPEIYNIFEFRRLFALAAISRLPRDDGQPVFSLSRLVPGPVRLHAGTDLRRLSCRDTPPTRPSSIWRRRTCGRTSCGRESGGPCSTAQRQWCLSRRRSQRASAWRRRSKRTRPASRGFAASAARSRRSSSPASWATTR